MAGCHPHGRQPLHIRKRRGALCCSISRLKGNAEGNREENDQRCGLAKIAGRVNSNSNTMKKIKVVIERSADLFSAYAENVAGVTGSGDSVEEAKKSLLKTIRLFKRYNTQKNIPEILKGEYELVYKFDVQSFLNYYKGVFTPAALERIAGINQKQIQHYSTGHRRPRPAQRKKIKDALHKLGQELIAVEL
jgi:hypothetical protein